MDELDKLPSLDVGATPHRSISSLDTASAVNRLEAMAILSGIFVVAPVLLFFGLRWLARRWVRVRPQSQADLQITLSGYVLYTSQVLFLLLCTAAYHLDSTGRIGAFLHTQFGPLVALATSFLGSYVVALAITHFGYPPTRYKGQRDV